MLRKCLAGMAVVLCLVLALTAAVVAQTRLASVEGRVMDESGATIPGVTITLTSPALQVPMMTAVSGSDGSYRVSELPIGTYRVSFELAGFRPSCRKAWC